MIQKVRIEYFARNYTQLIVTVEGQTGFPLLSIDVGSYLDGGEIQSGINFKPVDYCHCIAIGKSSSLATGIVFMIDMNHDYRSVFQGAIPCVQKLMDKMRAPRKGSIIIQNDVWVGYGAVIMAGVTLHNGCVVAAGAVVTKDVPPYAIVGGNPAKVIRYRFEHEVIDGLQKIAWWDWPEELKESRKDDFLLPVELFVQKYLPLAEEYPRGGDVSERIVVLFIPDVNDPCPVYPNVFHQYFAVDRPGAELVIYLPSEDSKAEHVQAIESILNQYSSCDSYVTLQVGETLDERVLMQGADYFITTRNRQTVYRTCLADRYHAKILYGTDKPVFPDELH